VADSFLNELLEERDQSFMVKKARAAGLVVTELRTADGTFVTISDPATGKVVLERSVTR
jgi:hypothetical protein